MKSILDPSFRYTNSANTDIRKTFARARREQRHKTVGALAAPTEPARVLALPLKRSPGQK